MIFKDESIFSFLFRTQIMFGHENFKNIFNNLGGVIKAIRPLPSMLDYYSKCDEVELAKSLNPFEKKSAFSDEYSECKKLKAFFTPGESVKYLGGTIYFNYCDECIAESIRLNGVGYFRNLWQVTTICSIHNKQLKSLRYSQMTPLIKNLKQVMSGQVPLESKINLNASPAYNVRWGNNHEDKPVFKACLKLKVKQWILKHQIAICDEFYFSQNYASSKFMHASWFAGKCFDDKHVERIYDLLYPVNFKGICDYMASEAEAFTEVYGFRNDESFKVASLKLKGCNCNRCEIPGAIRSCYMSKNIIEERLYLPVVDTEEESARIILPHTEGYGGVELITKKNSKYICMFPSFKYSSPDKNRLIGWVENDDSVRSEFISRDSMDISFYRSSALIDTNHHSSSDANVKTHFDKSKINYKFKKDITTKIHKGELTVAECSLAYHLSPTTFYNWLNEMIPGWKTPIRRNTREENNRYNLQTLVIRVTELEKKVETLMELIESLGGNK